MTVDSNNTHHYALVRMKFSSVSEAREFGKGQPLPGLTGKVARVWPQEQKEYQGEPYMKQGLVLKDLEDPSVEITLSLMDHAPYYQTIVGKTLQVIGEGKSQVKSEGEYKGKFYFKAGRGCDVTFLGGASPQDPARQPSSAQRPAPTTNQVRPTPANQSLSWEDYLATEEAIVNRCIASACRIASTNQEGIAALCGTGFEPAQIASIATGLRMGAMTAGLTIDSPTRNQKATPKPAPRAAVEPEDPGPSDTAEDDVPY